MTSSTTTETADRDDDWLTRQAEVSLAHLRSLDPALLPPVARELVASAEEREPKTYPPLRLVPTLAEDAQASR